MTFNEYEKLISDKAYGTFSVDYLKTIFENSQRFSLTLIDKLAAERKNLSNYCKEKSIVLTSIELCPDGEYHKTIVDKPVRGNIDEIFPYYDDNKQVHQASIELVKSFFGSKCRIEIDCVILEYVDQEEDAGHEYPSIHLNVCCPIDEFDKIYARNKSQKLSQLTNTFRNLPTNLPHPHSPSHSEEHEHTHQNHQHTRNN